MSRGEGQGRAAARKELLASAGKSRTIDLLVDDSELKKRAASRACEADAPPRGYAALYAREILGADEGCDFKFLRGL